MFRAQELGYALIKRTLTTKVVGKVPTIGKTFHTRAANLLIEVYGASGTLPMDEVNAAGGAASEE